jgi:uncharacterized protein (TIGR02147 family)
MLPIPLQRLLFTSSHYRDFLLGMIRELGKERGYKKKLADCAGCQPAYFSQVLAGDADLTPEHAEKLGQFWDLGELESDCFFTLVLFGRAGTASLRQRLERKLEGYRREWKSRKTASGEESLDEPDRAALYYSHWLYSAVHTLLSVPAYRTVEALARHLHRPKEEIAEVLADLERIGLVMSTEHGFAPTQARIHAESQSAHAEGHHKNWRTHALDAGRAGRRNYVRYTSVHTLSKADAIKVKDLVEQLIRESRKLIAPSPEETGACLVIDYFPV